MSDPHQPPSPPSAATEPVDNELGHRRRVLALADDIKDLLTDLVDRSKEFRELGVPPAEWFDLVSARLSDKVSDAIRWAGHVIAGEDMSGAPALGAESPATLRMRNIIARLFDEAPKLTGGDGKVDETQAPAIECHVLLRAAPQPFSGVLSATPEGTLRLLTPVPPERTPGKQIMLEHFFDYADVLSVTVDREVKVSGGVASSIIRPS